MDTSLTPEERSLRARIAVHTSWANTADPAERTAPARSAADARFERQARALHPNASDDRIDQVASHLRSAYFRRLALASAKARRAKTAAA